MLEGKALKALVIEKAKEELQARLNQLHTSIKAAQQAANEEGKSSMGDKYETARAMAQLDTEMLGQQWKEAEKTLSALSRLQEPSADQLAAGSLAQFANSWFWLAPGGGKIIAQEQTIFWVSPQSPWAKALMGMQVGEERSFNQKVWKLMALY